MKERFETINTYLTIFTPTYNREHTLQRLYKSLCNQTNKNFIWLIIDDGSTDNTKKLIKEFMDESFIAIQYYYQCNQGKHIAHNAGVEKCKTELFFCVDSDDYLMENAVEQILDDRKNIMDDGVSGIVTTRINEGGEPIVMEMPKCLQYSSLCDLYERHKFKGDTALVFKTKFISQFKFPKINNEKFIGEEYIYVQMDFLYKLYVSSKKYYVCQYLEDGYTKNMFKLIANNPKGYMVLKNMKFNLSKKIIIKYKAAALYQVGCWLCKEQNLLRKSPNGIISLLAYPLAILVYFIRFKRIKKN